MIDWLRQRLAEDEEVRVMVVIDREHDSHHHGVLVSVDKRGVVVRTLNARRRKDMVHVLVQWKDVKFINVTSEVDNE